MKLSAKSLYARIRNLRIWFFAALVLIGAFDYDFVSYAKENSFTSTMTQTLSSIAAPNSISFYPKFGSPPFWTSGGPEFTFRVDSFTLNGTSLSGMYISYYNSDDKWISKVACDVGVKYTISDINMSKGITFTTISSRYSAGNYTLVVNATDFVSLSDNEALNEIVDQNEKFHEEEKTEATNAGNDLGSTLDDVTGTLTKVEILKLPWTMLSDLLTAISSDGEKTLTFPSFQLMGQTLWPSYTFSLADLDSQFSVLFESVRLVSGVMLCVAFGNYIRSFFTKIFGKEESEEVS